MEPKWVFTDLQIDTMINKCPVSISDFVSTLGITDGNSYNVTLLRQVQRIRSALLVCAETIRTCSQDQILFL
jgi:hypothetical protein